MKELAVVLGAVLPVFCLAGAGAFLRKLDWLTQEADQSLLRVTVNLLIPCLIIESVLGNRALERMENVLFPPLIGFGTIAGGILIGFAGRFLAGLEDERKRRTFAFSIGIYNYGYVPLPLALMLFDRETVGVLFVHNVGVEVAFWTLGMFIMGGQTSKGGWRKLVNPPVVAIGAALLLNLVGGRDWLPEFLLKTASMLGNCAIPVGLILIGATIADQIHEFHADKGWRTIGAACLLRLGVIPVLFLLLADAIPASVELKRIMMLQAAMPAAVFSIIMAKHYGGDTNTALRVVIGTSVVALITIPVWIRIGMKWLEL